LALVVFCLPFSAQAAGPTPLSNAEPALAEFGKDVMDQSRPLAERLDLVRAFGGWATPQVRGLLVLALKDPAPEMRAEAAQALGWPGNREAIGALRERFEASGEASTVRAAAVRSFGRIGDPSVRPLVVAATQHSDIGVREAALWSLTLGSLVDPADRTSFLLRLAADQPLDGQLRCDAIRALAEVKEDRVVDTLLQILEREPRPRVALPAGPPTQQQIMALRYAQGRDVAAWAAGALGQFRAARALPLLLKTAEDPDDFFLRLMSLQALVAWNTPEARPVFVRRLEDPLPDNRILGLRGLAQLGDRTVTPSVLARLADASPSVRAQAVLALAALGDASVRPSLEALRKRETSSDVLGALEDALSHLPRP
jgi:HEAT repeat protein